MSSQSGAPRLSHRELLLMRALLATTGRSHPEISLAELALAVGLGKPTRELWRRVGNLEAKGYVAISTLPQALGQRSDTLPSPSSRDLASAATHIRLSARLTRDQVLHRYFTAVFEEHLSFEDDGPFLAALAAWTESEYARRVGTAFEGDADAAVAD